MTAGHPADAPAPARWLGLAATPTFAVMALAAGLLGDGPMDGFCSAGRGVQLTGMVPMYLLMCAFHSPSWLRLLAGRRRGAAASG